MARYTETTPADSDIHNDGEIWKTIPDFPDYEASNLGRIRSLPRVRTDEGGRNGATRHRHIPGVILRPSLNHGYPHVALTVDSIGHTRPVHRLVLEAFVGPRPDGMECRHLDGNRENAALSNLVWGTPSENQNDRAEHGTSNTGEQHPLSKLTELDVIEILWRHEAGYDQTELAEMFEVSRSTIGLIVSRERWQHVMPFRCTYCMDDDKLRIYSGYRFSDSVKTVIKDAGFRWAPKQEGWFTHWSIKAEDVCLQISGSIEDEDISPEERAADRAERFAGYRDKRRGEAGTHADRYDAGPQAFGNQNAARAERAAARHDRHRDRSLCQWSKAEYWQHRTAGVISHALHKSDARTRRGRIKTIEADLRRLEKSKAESLARRAAWQKVADAGPDADELIPLTEDGYGVLPTITPIQRMAYMIAGDGRCWSGWPRPEEEANAKYIEVHKRQPSFSPYDLLTENTFIHVPVKRWTPREVANEYLRRYTHPDEPTTSTNRAIEHLKNRLIYENAMLGNEGGMVGEVDMVPGGWIYGGRTSSCLESNPGGWQQILKVNKSRSTGRVTTVQVMGTYHSAVENPRPCLVTINVERMGESQYRAPTPEELEEFGKVKKAKKDATPTIPTINPTKEDAQRLQDKWNAEAMKDGKTTRVVEVKEMTQAEFSSGLKHEYTFIHTVNIGGEKVKLRLKRGGGFYDYHAAYQVIVLTDKPQKPLPAFEEPAAQAEPSEPAPVGALF